MATYSKATTSGNYTIYLVVNNVDQDIPNNRSKVQYKAYITGASGTTSWGTGRYTVSINGTQTSGSVQYDFSSSKTWFCVGSASAYVTSDYITHNSDGTKSINVSFSFSGASLVGSASINETFTLNTIPRASDVSVSNYSITNTSSSISATITSKANFYHKWRWKIGSGSWSGWTNKGLISTTSSTVTVANTSLLSGMPTSTSATFTIEVRTYSDSGYATHVGTKSASCTVSVNTSNIKPSVTLGNIAINTSPISGYAVAGYSSLRVHFATTNSSGASSVTTRFTINNGSLQTSSTSATSAWIYTNTLPASDKFYTTTIWSASTDSRGANSDTVNQSFGVWGYKPPTATLRAYRVADSSSTIEDGAGQYVYVTFSGSVNGLRDANGNIIQNNPVSIQTMTCTYSGDISGTATNGQHIALADTQAVTFTLTVNDGIASSTATANVAQASYPLDLYDNGSGSVGVGLGTNAIAGYVMTPLRFQVNNTNSANGGVEIREDGEGGKITIYSPSGKTFEFDASDNNTLRVWSRDDSYAYKSATFNRLSGVLSATGGFSGDLSGNATSATSANKVYFNRTTASPNDALTQNAMVVGEYYNQSTLPTSSGFYHVITLQGPDTKYGTQIAIGMTVRGVYYRRYINGSWTSWEGLL